MSSEQPEHVAGAAKRRTIDGATARELAVKACVGPQSIINEYREPGSVRGGAGLRARRALAEAGYLPKP